MTRLEASVGSNRELGLNEEFNPFEGMNFPTGDIKEEDINDFLISPFKFKGIDGTVLISADSTYGPSHYSLPLGNARLITEFTDDGTQITETPLLLTVQFYVTTPAQLEMLSKYSMEVLAGEERLFLPFNLPRGYKTEFREESNKDSGVVSFLFHGFWDANGEIGSLMLPFDQERVSQIQAKIVTRNLSETAS